MQIESTAGPLFTDLYQLTMAAAYFEHCPDTTATFSLFFRGAPAKRAYFVLAGVEEALRELEIFHFSSDDLAYLRASGRFETAFIDYLAALDFKGDVHAMQEGRIFFPDEPVLEVTASLIEAQLVETNLLNAIGFPTLVATKASRCLHAAAGRPLIDFALRRTQGRDAGMKVARSAYLAGFAGTSNVRAGHAYGIPVSGTMAHSFVTAFASEAEAFRAYARVFPREAVFLIDTYDTLHGAKQAAMVGREMARNGQGHLLGVRLDSGDMNRLSREVRKVLDEAGLPDVKIFASSGFDEYKISDAIARGASIDAFGVGTKLGVCADTPYADVVYKLVVRDNRPVRKLSPGKSTLAGAKQVFRKYDAKGDYAQDCIACRDERIPGSSTLLAHLMADGRRLQPAPPLAATRESFLAQFDLLPEVYKKISDPAVYPVHLSEGLAHLQKQP
jgi:nicotinate phosphoribosyltransferase